jgi:hypothetical protein
MKISDLLGEGWESDERSDAKTEPRAAGYTPAAAPPSPPSVVSVPPTVSDPDFTEPVEARAPDVIASLASWAPAPELRDPEPTAEPVSARAQLADLAAGLAIPAAPPAEEEPIESADEFIGLDMVVDDLLPDATKRKGSARGSSRSGSRRRGR